MNLRVAFIHIWHNMTFPDLRLRDTTNILIASLLAFNPPREFSLLLTAGIFSSLS